ncbi:MAG: TonB family protein [Candidatus Sulfotelmatobacter sp.]
MRRRRGLRYRVQAPLDVTVLRSGIPDTVPGRSENLGLFGIGAVMAGELLPGEAVGVEIQLPSAAASLRIRALVRHHDKLRCGMEFVGLTAEQQASIRSWAEGTKAEPAAGERESPKAPIEADKSLEAGRSEAARHVPKARGRTWMVFLLSAAVLLAGLWWWRWNRGWENLESGLKNPSTTRPQAQVPADVMQKLVKHRVDPDYPAAARPKNLRGVIVLDVVVGRDGSVVNVRALNGPEILAQAATDALRWWRFEPYRVDGRPVVAETTVAVEFKP